MNIGYICLLGRQLLLKKKNLSENNSYFLGSHYVAYFTLAE